MANNQRRRTRTTLPDLTGKKFHRLTVAGLHGVRSGRRFWLCHCDCGGTTVAPTTHLNSGNTKSCGCWERDVLARNRTTHGGKQLPEYQVWCHVKTQCYNPRSKSYPDYGGRGIKMCDRWRESFEAFLADMGSRPSPKHSIDRHPDNDGDYEPGNCRWATKLEQNRNTRVVRMLTFRGEQRCMSEWAEVLGLPLNTTAYRLNRLGWDVERALGTPSRPNGGRFS